MRDALPDLIFAAGIGQLCVLIASALVPRRLNWRTEFAKLSRLHRQMYWVYGGYVVLSIIALGVISIINAAELAAGSRLRAARAPTTRSSGASGFRCSRSSTSKSISRHGGSQPATTC